jgi:predicted nucleic acid-binding protein
MRGYLLDSNTVSDFYDKFSSGHPQIANQLLSLQSDDSVYMSILTLYELEYGFANAPEEKKAVVRQKLTDAQKDFEILPLSKSGATLFGVLQKQLKETRKLSKENLKKHSVDIMIATTAITNHCILVSADAIYMELQQFKMGLQLENWLSIK